MWWWCSGDGGVGCCKGCNSDCCRIAILKCILGGSISGASGSDGVVVVVVVVVVGYWWWWWWWHNGGSSGGDSFSYSGSCNSFRSAS